MACTDGVEGEDDAGQEGEGEAHEADLETGRKSGACINELGQQGQEEQKHFRIGRIHEKAPAIECPIAGVIRLFRFEYNRFGFGAEGTVGEV